MNKNTALIVVDVQNDFVEGGTMGVDGGNATATRIVQHLKENGSKYGQVITTQDWHIDPGSHFSDNPDFVDSWPVHCVADEEGSKLVGGLSEALEGLTGEINLSGVYKGMYDASYSGFDGVNDDGSIDEVLRNNEITDVHIVGIATDYCVRATALDANELGYNVTVLTDLVAGINPDMVNETLNVEFPKLNIQTKNSK